MSKPSPQEAAVECIEESKFICDICEHVLIDTVGATCGHTFCTYCLYLWMKNDSLCPTCGSPLGKITVRPKIDEFIADFFATANPLAQQERQLLISARKRPDQILDLDKVLFTSHVRTSSASRPGRSSDVPRQRTATATSIIQRRTSNVSYKPTEFIKLNKETFKLEKALSGTYNRILDLGAAINRDEDSAAATYFDSKGNLRVEPTTLKTIRPSTTVGPGPAVPIPRFQDKSEVEELLEQTNEMIKIEEFMKKFSFENIKVMDEMACDSDSPEIFHRDALRSMADLVGLSSGAGDTGVRNPKCAPVKKNSTYRAPKMHPNVEEFLKDKKIKTKIPQYIPPEVQEGQGDTVHQSKTDATTTEEVESPTELTRCRDNLIKIHRKYSSSKPNLLLQKPNAFVQKQSASRNINTACSSRAGPTRDNLKKQFIPTTLKPKTAVRAPGTAVKPQGGSTGTTGTKKTVSPYDTKPKINSKTMAPVKKPAKDSIATARENLLKVKPKVKSKV